MEDTFPMACNFDVGNCSKLQESYEVMKYMKKMKSRKNRRKGMKAVKEKEQLQKTLDSWKDSSKNIWRLIDYGMSSNSKVVLGFEIKSNNEVLSVPHPLSGDYSPKPQEEIDDSMYVYGKKGPQKPEISVSDENSSEHSTCQSNDSEGSYGNTSEHSFETQSESFDEPNEMSKSRLEVTNEKDVSAPKLKEVEPSCVSHIKTPRQPLKDNETYKVNRKNWNDMIERELGEGPSFNSEANINTGWTNINSGRPKVNTVSSKVNTVRTRQPIPHKTSNSLSPKRPQMNQINQRRDFSKSYSSVRRPFAKSTAQMAHSNAVMGSWGSAVKTSASYNWRNSRPNFNYNSGPTFIRTVNANGPQGRPKPAKAWDQLEDFEEFNGGSVTFGGSKGYISGKGRIRVAHKVLFTETECLVVSSDFKMPDENQILLKVPRHHNMYSFDMKTPTPAKGFACLIAKATSDESKLWHRRLGHINFKNLNKLVKGNLVRGLPSKVFKNDHTCVACHKGKQHRASCKAKLERLITVPLHTLHMDLFGPTSVRSINHASYCLVITDDCTRFSWVFFLASKDETSGILQTFIRQIENQLSHRVKIIRSDNGTEFKNRDMLEFCGNKGIKQEYSTILSYQPLFLGRSSLVLLANFNRVRVTKPQNKTPYELLFGHKPIISYIRPFGCHVTILDTLSVLGKFDGKSDEGFLVGYSLNSKAYRVYNLVTKRVEVNLMFNFLEDKPNVKGVGYKWMFDIDYLTDPMNYIPVSLENQANTHAGASEVTNSAGTSQTPKSIASEEKRGSRAYCCAFSFIMPKLEIFHKPETGIFNEASYDEEGVITDFNSLPTEIEEEPKKIAEALQDDSWVQAMQEELLQFKLQQVWVLVDLPHGMKVIGTIDERFMSHNPLLVFVDPDHPIKAWIQEGTIDKTLFIKRDKKDIMLVQVYVDDIIFGSTNKSWCDEFEALMKSRFQMSSMGELTFFLGLQVKQNKGGTFISQDKYVAEILKKFDLVNVKAAITPMETKVPLTKDEDAIDVDVHLYRSMIGNSKDFSSQCCQEDLQVSQGQTKLGLMTIVATSTTEAEYVAAANCCGQVLWVQNQLLDYGFAEIVDFLRGSNLRYALTSNPTIYDSLVKQFWQTATANTKADGSLEIKATIDSIGYTITEASIRDTLQLDDASGITMLPNNELFEGMGQMGYPTDGSFTFWKSFFTPQWRYLVHHLLHCISSKSGGWDQFGSNIATALICLSTVKENDVVAPSQPSSSSPPVASTSSPPVITTPTPIPASIPSPTPIPETQPEPFEHTFEEPSPVHQHFSPTQEQAQGQMAMDDLLHVVPKLISRIDSLETDLKQTKLTMGNAIVKLVKKVKKLEGLLKKRHVVVSDSEEEEPEAQGRKSQDDPLDSSVQGLVTPSTTKVDASGEEQVEDISPNTLEAAKTLSRVASLKPKSIDKGRRYKRRKETKGKKSTPSPDKSQREEKSTYDNEELLRSQRNTFYKRKCLAEAIRLDSLQKEEEAKQIHLDSLLAQRIAEEEELNEQQKKRKAQVQFKAQHYTMKIGICIRAKMKLSRIVKGTNGKLSPAKNLSFEESRRNFDKLVNRLRLRKRLKKNEAKDAEPTKKSGKRRKQMARKGLHKDLDDSEDSDEVGEQEESLTESMDIYMLIERTYPLSAEMCKAMLDKKLQGGKPDENCYKMLKMMEKGRLGIRKSETALGLKPSQSVSMVDNLQISFNHGHAPSGGQGLTTPE
ncbi:putative ribonuclease H-like domain-containing protein [Tanacetum coccineum]|uniref:Ribonuclease H-like domain-containing protein n=1 Tax=Tanacetum coccineum TaxID=301880 RepID=A0ABQ5H0D0_9ASTR